MKGWLWLGAVLALGACNPPIEEGEWIGDLESGGEVDRLRMVVDSGGRRLRLDARSLGLLDTRTRSARHRGDRLRIALVTGNDSVVLDGAVADREFTGTMARSNIRGTFRLRRLRPLSREERDEVHGTYRTAAGGLVGVAPFTEFGPHTFLVDYRSGRIGPILPIARDRFVWGRSLVAPLHPADTVIITRTPTGLVAGLQVVEPGTPVVEATRLATRDTVVRIPAGEAVSLEGTLTLPADAGPHPAIVLVHGSGPQSRDGVAIWQRYFAGLGFAVLGLDKRGVGGSGGDWKEADFHTLAGDVLAGVRWLAERRDIRRNRIGLFGASQAGWIMPLAVSRAPASIAFLVVHAGTGTTVREQGILNLLNEYRFAGASEEKLAAVRRYRELDDEVTRTGQGWEALEQHYLANKDRFELEEPAPRDHWFRTYYRMLMDYDPAETWPAVKVPVLLFFGELDANVPPAESWPPIERGLARAGNGRVEHHLLPKANHLFLEARTGARGEYPGLNRFVPGYFDRMETWLATFR